MGEYCLSPLRLPLNRSISDITDSSGGSPCDNIYRTHRWAKLPCNNPYINDNNSIDALVTDKLSEQYVTKCKNNLIKQTGRNYILWDDMHQFLIDTEDPLLVMALLNPYTPKGNICSRVRTIKQYCDKYNIKFPTKEEVYKCSAYIPLLDNYFDITQVKKTRSLSDNPQMKNKFCPN